jgi:DNA polymerase
MEDTLEKIKCEVLNCKKCPLYKERRHPVIGEGDCKAKIMFVGEAPGFNEDRTGHPFCGKAGGVLDELLSFAGIRREEIYITNILKCRPPQNRNPKEEEIKSCGPYLDRQIDIIQPKIICCLGNFATTYILKKFGLTDKIQGISKIHGQVFVSNTLFGPIKIIPLYHPAVVTYNPDMRDILKRDSQILKDISDFKYL